MDEGLHGGAVVQIGQQVHDVLGTRLVINLHSSAVAAKESDQLRQMPSPVIAGAFEPAASDWADDDMQESCAFACNIWLLLDWLADCWCYCQRMNECQDSSNGRPEMTQR